MESDGLYTISKLLNLEGQEFERNDLSFEAEKKYLQAINLNNDCAMMNLAVLYEKLEYEPEKIIKYYTMSIDSTKCQISMYNFADFYRTIGDFENMVKYYKMAIEYGNDIESMFYLALHYQNSGDFTNMKKYLVMPLAHIEQYYIFKAFKEFNILLVLRAYEETYETAILSDCPLEKEKAWQVDNLMKQIYKKNKDSVIYKNKKALFSTLNHIVECGICYETKLNIDLKCAHCVCVDCYTMVYNKPCPFCRIY